MSMSDAALSQSETAPPVVATWKPFVYTCGEAEYLKCFDEHVSQVTSSSSLPKVCRTLFVALQSTVYPGLDNMAVVTHNEVAIFTSLVGPGKRQVPLSTNAENVVPTAAPLRFPPCKIRWPAARAPSWNTPNLLCIERS